MGIQSAEWLDAEKTTLKVVKDDERTWFVPAVNDNADYLAVIEAEREGNLIVKEVKSNG